ncbi:MULTISPECIES: hypothetical protein [Amycolatopsis]|uniref:Uncharacterized protein n=1 Tax=Amycolatopsis albidoflavus TaxID=102226 RepID=A0ABW5I7N5_9PSEU
MSDESDPGFTPEFTAPTDTVDVKLPGNGLSVNGHNVDNWKALFGDNSISVHSTTSVTGHMDLSKVDIGTPDYHNPDPNLDADIDFARKFNVDGVAGTVDPASGDGFVKVDPNQLKAWADKIESELLPYVESIQTKLANQNLYIGGLPEAQNLQSDVAKLKDLYATTLQNSKTGLQKLVQDLRSAAKTYDSTAELTKDKAQYVSKLVSDMGQFTNGGTGTGAPTLNKPDSGASGTSPTTPNNGTTGSAPANNTTAPAPPGPDAAKKN